MTSKKAIHNHLIEWTDGFFLVAFEPETGQPMIIANSPDPKTTIAINALLVSVVQSGGIGVSNGKS